MTEVLFDIRNY